MWSFPVLAVAAASMLGPSPARSQPSVVVDPVPILDVPGVNATGDLVFGVATSATRLPDGSVAIADASSNSVRLVAPSGQLARVVGREGKGPGEFSAIAWVGRCGTDSVFVWDPPVRRISVIAPDGAVARQFELGSTTDRTVRPYRVDCSASGTFAYLTLPTRREPTPAEGVSRTYAQLAFADANGRTVRELGEVSFGEMVAARGVGLPRPLGKATTLAFAENALYVGTADSAAVTRYTSEGAARLITFQAGSRPATPALHEHAVQELAGTAPSQRARDLVTTNLSRLPLPERLPAYTAVLGDPLGVLWVVLSVPGDPRTEVQLIAPDGRSAGTLQLPRAMTIFEIGSDYVLGRYEDAVGEMHVAVYRLRRR